MIQTHLHFFFYSHIFTINLQGYGNRYLQENSSLSFLITKINNIDKCFEFEMLYQK